MGILATTVAASWAGMTASIILGYPLWVTGVITFLPWAPVLFTESLWKYRHYKWFSLYGIMIVTQTLHFIEHIAQIVEVDVIGLPRSQSRGIIGNLDAEYVHFFFDTSLLIGVIILLFKFRKSIPLWVALVVAIWHTAEHWYITYYYTFDRANYNPLPAPGLHAHEGLLGAGGLLWPSSPFLRIELHFFYNLLFTVPLVWGFILMVRAAYDEYLKKAFPRLTEAQLAGLNNSTDILVANEGEFILRQGDPADKFYIISRGEVEVIQSTGGAPTVVNRLAQGQFFGEVGLLTGAPRNASVRAVTRVELLALDRDTFRAVMGNSAPTAQDYAQVLAQRNSSPGFAAVGANRPPGAAAVAVASGPSFPQMSGPSYPQMSGPSYPQASSSSYPQASGPSFPQASGPSYPQASNPAVPQASGPSYPQASNPAVPQASGPSYPQASSPTLVPISNPGFAGPPPTPAPFAPPVPTSGATFQSGAGKPIDGPTLLPYNDPGVTLPPLPSPAVDPRALKTAEIRTPVFRDAANSWAYGLIFTGGQLQGQGVVLSTNRMQIGRDVGNEIRISDDAQVSRRHAELLRMPSGEFQIRDLRSSNGVFVNNQRLSSDETRLLQENDEVKIGNAVFALRKVGTRVV
jgi:hypothetical protein